MSIQVTCQTWEEIRLASDNVSHSESVEIEARKDCAITNVLYDLDDGFRPLNPLCITLDGVTVTLPRSLESGYHVITLNAIERPWVRLCLVGSGLNEVGLLSVSESSRLIQNVLLVGAINGVNKSFTLPKTKRSFALGSTRVYLNRMRLIPTTDYIEQNGRTIVLGSAPSAGEGGSDILMMDYSAAN